MKNINIKQAENIKTEIENIKANREINETKGFKKISKLDKLLARLSKEEKDTNH